MGVKRGPLAGQPAHVPGYVKYFFYVLGFGIIGGAWGLVRGDWKNVPPKS
jgi:hypothetical protein